MPVLTDQSSLLSWASDIDLAALDQARLAAGLPIVPSHVALMADAHVGIGATVGSVIPTKGAIIPSAVGVDIGCGMIASLTNLAAADLPDTLDPFIDNLHELVPAGVGKGHQGASVQQREAWTKWLAAHPAPPAVLDGMLPRAADQFGTLGAGNHFAEVCVDTEDRVWMVLHSGSRGVGNKLAQGHIKEARGTADSLAEQYHIANLADPDLAWFIEGTPEFARYMVDLHWAQEYAFGNRETMMRAAYRALRRQVLVATEVQRINCHHNYAAEETHGGEKVWVTRKGAIRAQHGDLGVIPGSMGTRSYIVRGLGNELSYQSCSHGAGRRLSRGAARRSITLEQFTAEMSGVQSWQRSGAKDLIDEAPSAYKDIDQVMADQADLVEIVATLRQVANYKGL